MLSFFKNIISEIYRERRLSKIAAILSIFGVCLLIFDLGFTHIESERNFLKNLYYGIISLGFLIVLVRSFLPRPQTPKKVRLFDWLLAVSFGILLLLRIDFIVANLGFLKFFNQMGWVYLGLFLFFIREISSFKVNFKRDYLNPAQLFVASFLLIIFLGTFFLLLPKATHAGIGLIDALFTATSAVCVTGLIVVDTGSYFTTFGQSVIMVLIQLGGLGIMTFASYFSYFFRGNSSYANQLMLKDISNSEKIGEVFVVLKKILLLTFSIEAVGALFIYFNLDSAIINSVPDRIFFSIFHSISGFCNAGFSTLENSLYEPGFRFNYPLHLIIAALFILGGIGFPILLNLYKYVRYYTLRKLQKIKDPHRATYMPWVLNLNSRIVLTTTLILLLTGTVFFYIFEYNNTLSGHSEFGKIVTAFFGAATPRTAGFNSVDTSALHFSTLMLVFLLMWIGASPASTGGGIKTSTFALATLNFLSLAKGKDRIEVYKREVSNISIRRAFGIISLSLIVIGLAIFLIAFLEQDKNIIAITFEAFSAYSTVGLSMGITAGLSSTSKLIIIATMFIGRVSMLTLLIAILRNIKHLNYRYPSEEILIN
ncbi:TrkH family potassium uptake protein [Salegentibacter salegens]|uniref:Potassium uptake protein, TrkH family n=1 Tax=Salegentibacter salegens TaxID=143223 RepID=A0A1M7KSZ0_9FLAO|nr:potassium transporter TrkG [Salegentibacter salegens]PRX48830.1 potassium uptake TrkH family protein [Salegentibacter salegens]SHM68157.1 potassium uptake protein, TrkH family [Salegentibacter salegens]